MSTLKTLICGAGVAGNALAFWLANLGHDVTVIERHPALRTTGLQIDLRGHGIEVMRRMGLEQAVRAVSVKEEGLQFVSPSGRRWAYFPANKKGQGLQSFTSDFEIMRGDLVRVLHDATGDRVSYLFGVTIETHTQSDSKVDVTLSDGSQHRFDLVVGADGQGSRTRRMMLGPDRPDSITFLDLFFGYFTVPQPMQKGELHVASIALAPGARTVMTRRNNPNTLQGYLSCKATDHRLGGDHKGDTEQLRSGLGRVFEDVGGRIDGLMEKLTKADDLYCGRPGLVRLESWSKGRVALVGDAGYGPTVNTGMGTTSAIVGAYVLAGEISKYCSTAGTRHDVLKALEEYDRTFRPFMDQVQSGVAEEEGGWTGLIPTSLLGCFLSNLAMCLASLFGIEVLSKFVLHEEIKGWSLPQYEGLSAEEKSGSSHGLSRSQDGEQ